MTSWKRGDANEDRGENLMKSDDLGDKVKGVGLKAAGELEQGIDNVKDRVTGRQDDLKGMGHKGSETKKSAGSHKTSGHEHHTGGEGAPSATHQAKTKK